VSDSEREREREREREVERENLLIASAKVLVASTLSFIEASGSFSILSGNLHIEKVDETIFKNLIYKQLSSMTIDKMHNFLKKEFYCNTKSKLS
jgi:hypothetical protein